jgi:peptidoglycan/LPS O-acetylase OafA/YrhL
LPVRRNGLCLPLFHIETEADMTASDHSSPRATRRWRRAIPWLLIIPYIGTLWVSTYASITPELWGIPFFYWYQFLWIGIGAAITIVVYLAEDHSDARRDNGGAR